MLDTLLPTSDPNFGAVELAQNSFLKDLETMFIDTSDYGLFKVIPVILL